MASPSASVENDGAADVDFASTAQELYALPLGGFTAARNARAKAARAAGDRDVAARIGALPKPSASAWLINRLVLESAEQFQRVLDLGSAMRSAQQHPDRDELRALNAERRRLLGELTKDIASASDGASASVLAEVERTLQAALASEAAAAAVQTGRLVRALTSDGLDPVDLTDAVGAAGSAPPAASARTDGGAADRSRRLADARRAAGAAERDARSARRAADEAERQARGADARAQKGSELADDLRSQLDALSTRLAAAEDDLAAAREASVAAHEAADDASSTADDAERAADDATATLARLDSGA